MKKYNKINAFTLIELLVVITIVGILSSITIPQFNSYKESAYDLEAQVDLKNIATAEEVYFVLNEEYLSCKNVSCKDLPGIARLNEDVLIEITALEESFTGKAIHKRGSGKEYNWSSILGGFI